MFDIFALNWQRIDNKIPKFIMPKFIKNWLIDNNSLTVKLKNKYKNFNVKVIAEKIVKIDENILGFSEVIKREVKLLAGEKELIYAISFIPTNCNNLTNIGNKPLGEIMFRSATRERIEITKTPNNIWGRKSIFNYKNHNIIVCEFFIGINNN